MPYRIYFYKTARGESPITEFIEKQDAKTQARTLHLISLLSENGPFLKPPFIKKLTTHLYELRISTRIEVRIFYSFSNVTYYLLHAFHKKSQKTPSKEIRIALDRLKTII